jgi:hypothetical protein
MWILATMVLCLPEVGLGQALYRQRRVPDQIQIKALENQIIAFRADETRTVALEVGEVVRSFRVFGMVGGVLTSDRILAISVQNFEWEAEPLELDEESPDMRASEKMIFFVSQTRAMIFDGEPGRFVSFDLPIGENFLAQRVGNNVAVAVTMKRAVGFASGNLFFEDFSFTTGEIFRSIHQSVGMISVETSDRILSYASGAEWTVRSLPLDGQGP